MYRTKLIETEVTVNETTYQVDLDVLAKLVDSSFSHGFGIEDGIEFELSGFEVVTVYDMEGQVITNQSIINKIENAIDVSDYIYEEFEL